MNNRYAFVLGILFIVPIYIGYYEFRYGGETSYDYHPKAREVLIEVLEERKMLYLYKVDHLKRHWITPMTRDTETLDSVVREVNRRLGRDK